MKRLFAVAVAVAASVAIIAGGVTAAPKGSLKIAGSNTVLPLSQLWAETFMGKHSAVRISVSGGGTGQGIAMLLNGTCDFAMASREATKKEIDTARSRNSKLVPTRLAKDGLAIIVHPSNNVKNLTMDQLKGIYNGKINNWKAVGGDSNRAIVTVGRDTSSGTYGYFREAVLGGGNYRKDMLSMPTTTGIVQAVSQSKDGIGYAGIAYADKAAEQGKVRVVSISRKKGEAGLRPTKETVDNNTYPLFRYLYAYTLGAPKGLVADFLKYATSSEGQSIVRKSGYEPLK